MFLCVACTGTANLHLLMQLLPFDATSGQGERLSNSTTPTEVHSLSVSPHRPQGRNMKPGKQHCTDRHGSVERHCNRMSRAPGEKPSKCFGANLPNPQTKEGTGYPSFGLGHPFTIPICCTLLSIYPELPHTHPHAHTTYLHGLSDVSSVVGGEQRPYICYPSFWTAPSLLSVQHAHSSQQSV